jgi:hypothetical protein
VGIMGSAQGSSEVAAFVAGIGYYRPEAVLQLCRSGLVRWADASSVSCLFKWRQFEPKVILLAVGWYLLFWLS